MLDMLAWGYVRQGVRMHTLWKTGGMVTFLLTLIVGVSHAYDGMPSPEDMGLGYNITAGAAFSVTGNTDNTTSPILGVAWYGPLDPTGGDMAALGLSADWIGIKRNDGEKISLIPILLNYKRSGLVGQYRVFVNLGLGIQVATDDIPEMRLDDGASFAWTGGIGIDITNNVFAVAKFIGGQHPGEDGLASISLGYRF